MSDRSMPPAADMVSALDLLGHKAQVESLLRAAAGDEWAGGVQGGPMRAAHDQSVRDVVAAARELVRVASARGIT